MPIRIACRVCGDVFIAPDHGEGKKARCLNCHAVFIVSRREPAPVPTQPSIPEPAFPQLAESMVQASRPMPPPVAIPQAVPNPASVPAVECRPWRTDEASLTVLVKNCQNLWLVLGWAIGAALALGILIWFSTPTPTAGTVGRHRPVRDVSEGLPQDDIVLMGTLQVPVSILERLTNRDPFDPTRPRGTRVKVFRLHLKANMTYSIILESDQFDPYLRLEDDLGGRLVENDDGPRELGFGRNSRIVYRPSQSGTFKIYATSLMPATGNFRLLVREGIAGPGGIPQQGFRPGFGPKKF